MLKFGEILRKERSRTCLKLRDARQACAANFANNAVEERRLFAKSVANVRPIFFN